MTSIDSNLPAVQFEPDDHPSARGILGHVGNTPLVEIPLAGTSTRLFAKLESVNPGGSIKDRPVARMLTKAIERGDVRSGGHRRVLDSSSGNAGIAYAQMGAALGIPVTLVVPANASQERIDRIRAHGAELVLTDPIEGYDFAIRTARRMGNEDPGKYWYSDQYSNDDNWRAHYEGTGREIIAQMSLRTGGTPDVFVGGVGTGGTFTGVVRRLREANPGLYAATVIPELFPGIEGLKPLGHEQDLVPAILDESLIDERLNVELEEAADVSMELARLGLYVGPSSGAYVCAARRLASSGDFGVIVTILNDTGERYGSTGMWQRPG